MRPGVNWVFAIFTNMQAERSDVRVLKAQLDLAAQSVRATRVTSPLWALTVALLCSGTLGIFGNSALADTLYLPLIVAAAVVMAAAMTAVYQKETARDPDCNLALWYRRHCAMQLAVSAAWGTMPWLLWDAGNPVNHIFLAASSVAVVSGLVAARGGNMALFIAGLVPISLMTTIRFAIGDTTLDHAIALAAPLFALQMWWTGRPLVLQMQEDTRLRFQVEDLARELEETRDEALKKRFEAETANASKTAFLANMSHELRTPLNAILGFSEIIAQECFGSVGNPRYKDYAGDIHSSGAHLLSLINDLLDIAKIEAGRMEISPNPLEARRTFEIALKLAGSKANEKRQNSHHSCGSVLSAALCRRTGLETDPDQSGLQCGEVHARGRPHRSQRQHGARRRFSDHGPGQWPRYPAREAGPDLHAVQPGG